MRRLVIGLAALAALALAAPATAVTNGSVDGNQHPERGRPGRPQAYSDGTWIYCSGTLIARPCSSPPRTAARAATAGCG